MLPSHSRSYWPMRCFLKPEGVISDSLATLKVALAGYKADQPISVKTDRADIVDWLPVRFSIFEPVNNVVLFGCEQFVSRFLRFKLIATLDLLMQRLQGLAQFNIRHIRGGQFVRQSVQQSLRLSCVRRFITVEQTLDCRDCVSRLVGEACCTRSKAKHRAYLLWIHLTCLLSKLSSEDTRSSVPKVAS